MADEKPLAQIGWETFIAMMIARTHIDPNKIRWVDLDNEQKAAWGEAADAIVEHYRRRNPNHVITLVADTKPVQKFIDEQLAILRTTS